MNKLCSVALLVAVAAASRIHTAPDVAAKVAQESQENIQIHDNFAAEEKKDIAKEKQVKANKDLSALQAFSLGRQAPPQGQKEIPEECVKGMEQMKSPEFAQKAQECEQKGQYPQKAVEALKSNDEKAATGHIEELFMTCGKLSKKCAGLVVPQLIIQLRFSGAAVSDECKDAMEKQQKDEKRAKEVQECEKKEKLSENVLSALSKGDLDSAINSTESGLQKCMGLSKKCSWQIAPVIVNTAVMRAMMEQMSQEEEVPMTTVLVAQPVIVVEEPVMVVDEKPVDATSTKAVSAKTVLATKAAKHGKLSLLAIATGHVARRRSTMRGNVAPALIQEGSRHRPFVSQLIVELAMKKQAAGGELLP